MPCTAAVAVLFIVVGPGQLRAPSRLMHQYVTAEFPQVGRVVRTGQMWRTCTVTGRPPAGASMVSAARGQSRADALRGGDERRRRNYGDTFGVRPCGETRQLGA